MTDQKPKTEDQSLEPVRQAFEEFGRSDPMYAALSRRGRQDQKWDRDEFFERGGTEIRDVLAYVDSLGLPLNRSRALDFGCAIGRLTQALAEHFDEAVGVDIAATMIAGAREHNRHGDRVRYLLNTAPDLRILESDSFDFVYTNKVLQHIPPENQAVYVKDFMRVLRPSGIAVFQMRNGPPIRPGSVRAWLYTLNRRHLRRLFQRIRGRPPYEMHYLARSRVEEVVTAAGGRIVDVLDLSRGKPGRSLRYCAVK